MAVKQKKIINGKTYNVDTATRICGECFGTDHSETLYVTKKGAYFHLWDNCWGGYGWEITPMTEEEAMAWTEKHGTAEEYAEFFGEPEEAGADGESRIKTARETAGLDRKDLCEATGIPLRTLENYEGGQRKPPKWVEDLLIEKIEQIEYDRF